MDALGTVKEMMQRKEAVYEYEQRRPHTGMISALVRFLYTFTMMLMSASLLVFVSDLLLSLVSHSRCSDILLKVAFCGISEFGLIRSSGGRK